jgi:hypothetical protein
VVHLVCQIDELERMRRAERYFLIGFAVIGFAFVLHMVFKKLRGGEEK